MSNYVESLRDEIAAQLESAATSYLRTGLSVFHQSDKASWRNYQPAVGNLCIAVELLLKTTIARKAFRYLFTDLPLEAQVYLSYPETLPDASAFRRFAVDLKSFEYKTPELDGCVSLFYALFPDHRAEFRPYLRLLAQARNRSIHASLPTFQKYDLYRVAYLALTLFQFLGDVAILTKRSYNLTNEDEKFLKEFNAERVSRVHKLIEAAKAKSKKLDHYGVTVDIGGIWEKYTTECPVCGSGGTLHGTTDMHGFSEEDVSLDFDADSFVCSECSLELHDIEELKIAGMDLTYDRGEDWDTWMEEMADEDYY